MYENLCSLLISNMNQNYMLREYIADEGCDFNFVMIYIIIAALSKTFLNIGWWARSCFFACCSSLFCHGVVTVGGPAPESTYID